MNELINKLEKEWEEPEGFFYELRYKGMYNRERLRNYVNLLQSLEIHEEQISRRLVSLLWYVPLFMSWQKERVLERGGDVNELEKAIDEITTILEDKLGVP